MPIGLVKWWNDDSGYGFIVQSGGPDIFVHHSAIQVDGYPTLTEGQEVEYETREGPRGPVAANVRRPGDSVGPLGGAGGRLLQSGVRLFSGDSLRSIEYEINEWAEFEGVVILSVSVVTVSGTGYRTMVAYSARLRS